MNDATGWNAIESDAVGGLPGVKFDKDGRIPYPKPPIRINSPADTLDAMSDTFRERNGTYGSNYETFGEVMGALYPNSVRLESVEDFKIHGIFVQIVFKLTRLVASDLTHVDSVHDLGVYAAILQTLIEEHNES